MLNPEEARHDLTRQFFSKQAYVKKKSVAALSTKSSRVSRNFKTFYPPNSEHYGTQQNLPKINRFNEEFETASTTSKMQKVRPEEAVGAYANLLSKAKSTQNLAAIQPRGQDSKEANLPSLDNQDQIRLED